MPADNTWGVSQFWRTSICPRTDFTQEEIDGIVADIIDEIADALPPDPEEVGIAVGDESTDLATAAPAVTFRMPFAMTLLDVRSSVNTAPTGSVLSVNIKEGGVTVLSTMLTIDAGEKTSTTAATPYVISDTVLADDAEITIDIVSVGSTIPGKGLKVWLIGTRL